MYLLDRTIDQVRTMQLAAVLARANGGEVEVPTVSDAIADFDTMLIEPTSGPRMSREELELRTALGLRVR